MSAEFAALEVTTTRADVEDDDLVHLVCHCTSDNTAACRRDCTNDTWRVNWPEDRDCALCLLAWPDGSPTCPWGCSCEECGL